jgi:kanamycin nucleotidyltransferase
MGTLSVLRVLHGDPERVQGWLRLGQSVPQEKFRAALEAALPELILESFGRIHSCRERGNTRDIGLAALEVLHEINEALCLLNGRWITHAYYQGLADAFTFPKLPGDYSSLVSALWDAREIDEIVPLATRLLENFRHLLAEEGIRIIEYQSMDEIPL